MIKGRETLIGSGVYAIRCIADGRIYVGSSIALSTRLGHHEKALRRGVHGNANLQQAWSTFGSDSFECYVLEFSVDRAALSALEQAHRVSLASRFELFNIAAEAGKPPSTKGSKRPLSAIAATSAKLRGRSVQVERREKISASLLGRAKSAAHRESLRWTAEQRERHERYHRTPEGRANLSAAGRARWAKKPTATRVDG